MALVSHCWHGSARRCESWCRDGPQWSPNQEDAPTASEAVLGCLIRQTHAGDQHSSVALATARAAWPGVWATSGLHLSSREGI